MAILDFCTKVKKNIIFSLILCPGICLSHVLQLVNTVRKIWYPSTCPLPKHMPGHMLGHVPRACAQEYAWPSASIGNCIENCFKYPCYFQSPVSGLMIGFKSYPIPIAHCPSICLGTCLGMCPGHVPRNMLDQVLQLVIALRIVLNTHVIFKVQCPA